MSSIETSFESWLLSYFLNSLWQVPVLFAFGWLAARAMRKTGAATEHRVWVSTLLLQSFLPAFAALHWNWLGIPSSWNRSASPLNGAHISIIMGAGTTSSALHLPATLLTTIAIPYITVFAFFATRFLWRCHELHALRLHATEIALTGQSAASWSRCENRFGIHGATLATSSRIAGPVTLGFSRKLVLLPSNMISSLNDADIHTVIAHEFAHMSRNDFLKNLLYELLSLPVSYHPLSWLTRERITESREIVCDQIAAQISGRIRYAQSLLRLASLLVEGIPARNPQAIGIFDTNTFERRLMKLAEKQSELPTVRRLAIVFACIAFGLVTCGSALALSMHVDAATSAASSASQKAGPLTVSPQVMAANRIGGVDPKYPAAAKKAKIHGTVVLKAFIGKDGNVINVTVISGPNELRTSSVDAVKTWKYKPFLQNGHPVEVETQVHVVYSLSN